MSILTNEEVFASFMEKTPVPFGNMHRGLRIAIKFGAMIGYGRAVTLVDGESAMKHPTLHKLIADATGLCCELENLPADELAAIEQQVKDIITDD